MGWVLAALGAACVCSVVNGSSSTYEENNRIIERQNNRIQRQQQIIDNQNHYIRRLEDENRFLKLTIENQRQLLANYDYVNRYAKSIGYRGAVDFFYYLAEYHDSRLGHFARFLNKVRCVRNDVAHNGYVYQIDDQFLNKLNACKYLCDEFQRLPYGSRLLLN